MGNQQASEVGTPAVTDLSIESSEDKALIRVLAADAPA